MAKLLQIRLVTEMQLPVTGVSRVLTHNGPTHHSLKEIDGGFVLVSHPGAKGRVVKISPSAIYSYEYDEDPSTDRMAKAREVLAEKRAAEKAV